MTKIRLLAKIKGFDDPSWHVRMVEHGETTELVITRGSMEPITIQICAEAEEGSSVPEVRWSDA